MKTSPQYPAQREELLKKFGDVPSQEINFIRNISKENPFNPLKAGDKVPEFKLKNHHGKDVNFSSIYSRGPVVLSFNRGNWCGFCQMELNTWKSFLTDLAFYSSTLVSITSDITWRKHFVDSMEGKDNLVLLEDQHFEVADRFGLRYKMSEEYVNAFEAFGMSLNDFYGEPAENDVHSLPVPATFVINSEGIIIYDYFNTDYTQRVEPYEIIKVLIKNSKN
ncbi:MAG: hypothetical protein CL840_08540 [Crocinitomicaceae bacterium]|nr:hypothetical protein [Crocinitomicaceae bacterium]|tara:strand:+ start:1840 stop:2502 length:663 start_codon:yes stop_codon:yes gene_type:complete